MTQRGLGPRVWSYVGRRDGEVGGWFWSRRVWSILWGWVGTSYIWSMGPLLSLLSSSYSTYLNLHTNTSKTSTQQKTSTFSHQHFHRHLHLHFHTIHTNNMTPNSSDPHQQQDQYYNNNHNHNQHYDMPSSPSDSTSNANSSPHDLRTYTRSMYQHTQKQMDAARRAVRRSPQNVNGIPRSSSHRAMASEGSVSSLDSSRS